MDCLGAPSKGMQHAKKTKSTSEMPSSTSQLGRPNISSDSALSDLWKMKRGMPNAVVSSKNLS